MENMVLTKELIDEALSILDIQRSHVKYKKNEFAIPIPEDGALNREQNAYYDGMVRMLDMIISENFSNNVGISRIDGKHYLNEAYYCNRED